MDVAAWFEEGLPRICLSAVDLELGASESSKNAVPNVPSKGDFDFIKSGSQWGR